MLTQRWYERDDWHQTQEWRDLRLKTIRRDGGQCVCCGAKSLCGTKVYKGLTAHHIMPRAKGGGDYLDNLITLCETCHDEIEGNGVKSPAAIIGFDSVETIDEPLQVEHEEPAPKQTKTLWAGYGKQKAMKCPHREACREHFGITRPGYRCGFEQAGTVQGCRRRRAYEEIPTPRPVA